MEKIMSEYKVVVWNIEVEEDTFSFEYELYKNGELINDGEYQDEHVWGDDKETFAELLEEDASVLVLQRDLAG